MLEVKKCACCGIIINIPYGIVNGKYVCSPACFEKQREDDANALKETKASKTKKKEQPKVEEPVVVDVEVKEEPTEEPEVAEEAVEEPKPTKKKSQPRKKAVE